VRPEISMSLEIKVAKVVHDIKPQLQHLKKLKK